MEVTLTKAGAGLDAQAALFDYSALGVEDRVRVQSCAEAIRRLVRNTAQQIVEIGESLREVRGRLGDAAFETWLAAEFDWHVKTAYRFIAVADQFSSQNLLEAKISSSALYLLAAPSTPKEARAAAVELAKGGGTVTRKVAKAVVRAVKVKRARAVEEAAQELPVPPPEPRESAEAEPDLAAEDVERCICHHEGYRHALREVGGQDSLMECEAEGCVCQVFTLYNEAQVEPGEQAESVRPPDEQPVLPDEWELVRDGDGWRGVHMGRGVKTLLFPDEISATRAAVELNRSEEFLGLARRGVSATVMLNDAPVTEAAVGALVEKLKTANRPQVSPEGLAEFRRSTILITLQLLPSADGEGRQAVCSVKADDYPPYFTIFKGETEVLQGLPVPLKEKIGRMIDDLPARRAEAEAKKAAAAQKEAPKESKPPAPEAKPAKPAKAQSAKKPAAKQGAKKAAAGRK
jgi:pyruvate/2-oxoglutarate dehydrogenase complex dihydrolipoamide acyltransferase (E2) component